MIQSKTTSKDQDWTINLRSRVGDSVNYNSQTWTNISGKNGEPGVSADWEANSSVVDVSGKEDVSNKQNSLAADLTNLKYPTVSAVNSGLGSKVGLIQVTNQILTVSSWVLFGDFYESNLANTNITLSSVVNAIPSNSSLDLVRIAEISPSTLSSAGSVRFYSKKIPTDDVKITINIIK
jgi:hypothetical protein